MAQNRFIEKFRTKSASELEGIAMNSKLFVLEARHAAVILLKDRNSHATIIEQVEREGESLEKAKHKIIVDKKKQDQNLIKRIRHIPINGTRTYGLENGNELQVKRLSEDRFQVRIESTYNIELAPVMICKIKDESTYFCYPFLYVKSILIYGFGGTVLTIILCLLGYLQAEIFVFLLPLIGIIGIQVVIMPLFFIFIRRFFRERLGRKKNMS